MPKSDGGMMRSGDMEAQEPLLAKEEHYAEVKQQEEQARMRKILAVFTVSWMVLGIVAGTQIEGWTLLTSCYVFVQIVTTIGYGDITVSEPRMKMFMALYVLVCIVLVAGFFTDLVNGILCHESQAFMSNVKKAGDKADGVTSEPAQRVFQVDERLQKYYEKMKVCSSGLVFSAFVIVGTVFYATQEGCSCSYGATFIDGCVQLNCAATGGAVKTWIDSFYMAVITLTTVGFGDHSPKSVAGRVFGCFWMALGTGAFANFVCEFGKVFLTAHRSKFRMSSKQVFKRIDKDKSGLLSSSEFKEFALLKWGLVTAEQMEGIERLFKQIDKSGDGTVSLEELELYCDDKKKH